LRKYICKTRAKPVNFMSSAEIMMSFIFLQGGLLLIQVGKDETMLYDFWPQHIKSMGWFGSYAFLNMNATSLSAYSKIPKKAR
jgi:hypothetical protein